MTAKEVTEALEHNVFSKEHYETILLHLCDLIICKYTSKQFSMFELPFLLCINSDARYLRDNLKNFENSLHTEALEDAIRRVCDPPIFRR